MYPLKTSSSASYCLSFLLCSHLPSCLAQIPWSMTINTVFCNLSPLLPSVTSLIRSSLTDCRSALPLPHWQSSTSNTCFLALILNWWSYSVFGPVKINYTSVFPKLTLVLELRPLGYSWTSEILSSALSVFPHILDHSHHTYCYNTSH